MPLEGKLNSFRLSHETVVASDHPAVLRALVMDDTVVLKITAGTILKSVTGEEDGAKYAVCEEADTPSAVLTEDYDPGEGKKYADCLLHGAVKKEFLKTNGQKPKLAMLDKLQAAGIFAV